MTIMNRRARDRETGDPGSKGRDRRGGSSEMIKGRARGGNIEAYERRKMRIANDGCGR
jgi:hypothetical protein